MKQNKKIKCFKCSLNVSWANMNCVFGDGLFNTIKNKIYCFKCFYNKARKTNINNNSISLLEYLNK